MINLHLNALWRLNRDILPVLYVLVALVLVSAFAADKFGRTLGVDIDKVMNNIETFFNNMNVMTAVFAEIIIVCAVLCISILISIRIINKKEF